MKLLVDHTINELYCAYGEFSIESLGSYMDRMNLNIHDRWGHSMISSSVCIFYEIENHDPFECEQNNNCILLQI